MSFSTKIFVGSAGLALWLFIFGFVLFANLAMREPTESAVQAGGIVVLTGEGLRLKEGARLLKAGRARQMLISGVNPKIREKDLRKLTGLQSGNFACCVELGYQALNTTGNADETLAWVRARSLDSVIVVTASYHMPRSLAELARVLPSTRLIPHPVLPRKLRGQTWWLSAFSTRVLLSEYLKFLPSVARLGAARVLEAWNKKAVAKGDVRNPLTSNVH